MKRVEFTKLSSRGQVVIPKNLRSGLEEGTLFIVTRKNDLIIFKEVKTSLEEFEALTKRLRKAVKKTGLKPSDVPKIIHRIRGVKE
ncbi:MAG: AbrB/MazE/SpoVT family DNA-binding domain-containing protein [Candidatus Aenigmarchaeota archaeon]|nr:AbrB/MazE/SpoVT family DNA-binding domain-containing protein [Candidatus Aenigmarchaeota archaeon]